MKVSIIAIGDELLIGQVTDTNSGSIARIIDPAGWSIDNIQVVHDDADAIRLAIDKAFDLTDIVLTTGGLGPTKDDITKNVLCDYFGGVLRMDYSVLDNIKEVFNKRGITINSLTETQALVPTTCRVIQNLVGTAPIMWFERNDGKILVSMPGVPFETVQMFRSAVFPALLKKFHSDYFISHRTVIVSDMTESAVAMSLDDWETALPSFVHLAYLPKPGLIRLRLDGTHHDECLLNHTLDKLKSELIDRFNNNILCTEDLTPEEALIEKLRANALTVATAESCTGGNIAHRIISIAGCSDVYLGSVVSYANSVKTDILHVNPDSISTHGAVSEDVAIQMAEGARAAIGSDCAIATSGIAGPSGATADKPVGTVCIAVATPKGVTTRTCHFPGSRDRVIDRATTTALSMLVRALSDLK